MSSATAGQYDVILHKLNTGKYQVKYGKHVVECNTKDEAVDEYVGCLSHAMTCGELMPDGEQLAIEPDIGAVGHA